MRGKAGHIVRRSIAIAIAVAAFVTTLPATPANAYYRDRQRQLEHLISQNRRDLRDAKVRERTLLDQIHQSDLRRQALESQLVSIRDQLQTSQDHLRLIEVRLVRLAVELRFKSLELERSLAALSDQTQRLNDRVKELYISAPTGVTAILGTLGGLDDVISADQFASSIVSADQALLNAVRSTKTGIELQRASIAARQATLETERAAAQEETQRIGTMTQRHVAAAAAVQGEIDHRIVLLGHVRDQKAEFRKAIRSYVHESASIADFLRGHQHGQGGIVGRGGWLKWPVSGSISSPFGWRRHPVYGYRSFHTGIDIPNPTGTTVHAARAGQVLYTGYKGAFGLVVIIDHGSSVATMYAHLSRTLVRAGQAVSTRQAVGEVGTTGWSTGPHLHFEVRVNGQPVNPLGWL